MPIDIDENVFGLQVSIEHILVVDVLKAQQDFRKVKFGLCLSKETFILQ